MIVVHLTHMYGEVLLITPVSVLLAFEEDLVVKEISIGVEGGADRVIHKSALGVMVEINPVVILSLATLSLFNPRKSDPTKTYGSVVTFSLPSPNAPSNQILL